MGRSRRHADWLASKVASRSAGFRREYLDFDRGIRMGHLEPEERITQIVKTHLTEKHGIRMLCDRWGRGVYWQWICWVPEPNRKAKPVSSAYNFASSKFFVAVERDERVFQAGMQVERAPTKPGTKAGSVRLVRDWDWHVLIRALRGEALPRVLHRLLREGFRIRMGPFSSLVEYDRKSWDPARCPRKAQRFAPGEWGGFQLFWPMPEDEVRATSGEDIIGSVLAVFDEVAPAMNLCMYSPCLRE